MTEGAGVPEPPREGGKEHTRILRVMLAVPDSVAYWQAPALTGSIAQRTRAAFEGHWFGTKSEARVKTLMGDMALRFDAYPRALEVLRSWRPPGHIAPWICHFHTQLADPIYRRFTGEYLPRRLGQGYATLDRETVARWVQETWPGRWSPTTSVKFGGNMLGAAHEAGLFKERKDPRKLSQPRVPTPALEYLLYLLREVQIEGGIFESRYFCSVAPDKDAQAEAFRNLSGVRVSALGDVRELEWAHPDLQAWAQAQKEAA